MGKRARITNDRLNSYGTRVLTAGVDTEQYERNPVLLYMHQRGEVIGYVKDVEKSGNEITGELVFDEATELSRRCKKQWEFGSLKMVSAGLDIIEMSDEEQFLVPGQTSPTITRSKLFEVSLVDIGANDDAIQLRRDGKEITLAMDGECPLPKLDNKPKKKGEEMEMKTMALQLGLPETASEAEVNGRIAELLAKGKQVDDLQREKDALTLSQITSLVEGALKDKKFGQEKKEHFVELGKKIGVEALRETLDAMSPSVKLSAMIAADGREKTYARLSDVPEDKLEEMRRDDMAQYKRLYKAEYGMECEI